jgi:hypothetical protein
MSDDHNFGKRLVLVCWLGVSENDYLALHYKNELQNIQHTGTMHVREGVKRIKKALVNHEQTTKFNFYHSYMRVSVKRYLSNILNDYSYHLLYDKAAQKIQLIWLKKYYDPQEEICKRRIEREFYMQTSINDGSNIMMPVPVL